MNGSRLDESREQDKSMKYKRWSERKLMISCSEIRGGGGGPRERLIGPKAYRPFSALTRKSRSDDVGQFGQKSAINNQRSIHLKSFPKRNGIKVSSEGMLMGSYGGVHLFHTAF
jgi:hypothetical protein